MWSGVAVRKSKIQFWLLLGCNSAQSPIRISITTSLVCLIFQPSYTFLPHCSYDLILNCLELLTTRLVFSNKWQIITGVHCVSHAMLKFLFGTEMFVILLNHCIVIFRPLKVEISRSTVFHTKVHHAMSGRDRWICTNWITTDGTASTHYLLHY